jgi:hypothetical protein
MTAPLINALWRSSRRHDWQRAEIFSAHASSGQLVMREVDRIWPGVWLAPRDQVRIAGPEFEPCERPLSNRGIGTWKPRGL